MTKTTLSMLFISIPLAVYSDLDKSTSPREMLPDFELVIDGTLFDVVEHISDKRERTGGIRVKEIIRGYDPGHWKEKPGTRYEFHILWASEANDAAPVIPPDTVGKSGVWLLNGTWEKNKEGCFVYRLNRPARFLNTDEKDALLNKTTDLPQKETYRRVRVAVCSVQEWNRMHRLLWEHGITATASGYDRLNMWVRAPLAGKSRRLLEEASRQGDFSGEMLGKDQEESGSSPTPCCPHCRSHAKVVSIDYVFSPTTIEQAIKDHKPGKPIRVGGCYPETEDPTHFCDQCWKPFQSRFHGLLLGPFPRNR